MTIRSTKKAMKNSNGFFTIIANNIAFPVSESDVIKYEKKGIQVNTYFGQPIFYMPYNNISQIIKESIW